MINTIFYFANKNEYERARQNGEISSRTISFVTDDASDVGTIYKNGVRYSGISSIDNSTVLNIIGQSVSWNGVYNEGTKIGSLVVNGNSTDVYIPTQQPGGSTTIENPYDDTEIKQQLLDAYDRLYGQLGILDQSLRDANALATQRYNELNSRLDGINTTVINYVTNMFDDTEWFDEHFGEKIAQSNFGEQNVDAYLQRIGIYTKDANGNIVKDWSSIEQDVDKINLAVNALIYGNSVDQDDVQALWSRFNQTVQDTTDGYLAQLQLSTGWAQTEQDVDDITNIVKWMYSEITQQASQNLTLNDIVSAASDNNHNGISQLRTRVSAIENGYVAEADLAAKVDQAIAGLHSEAGSNYAKTLIFNKINQNTDDISAIVSTITNDQSSVSLATKLGSLQGGVVTTTGLDLAITSLLADSNSGFHSGISTYVTQNSAGFDLIAALGGTSGDTVSAAIIGAINNDQSQITIHADKINLDGNTYIKNLVVDEIKDADGNSVQTSYIIDTINNNPYCYITYNESFAEDPEKYEISYTDKKTIIQKGDTLDMRIHHNSAYLILGSITIKMGGADITNRCIRNYNEKSIEVYIEGVNDDISINITDLTYTPIYGLYYVDAIPLASGGTSWAFGGSAAPLVVGTQVSCVFSTNDDNLIADTWTSSNTDVLEIVNNNGISFNAKAAGTSTVTITTVNSTTIQYEIKVVNSYSENDKYVESFGFTSPTYDHTIWHTSLGINEKLGTWIDWAGNGATPSYTVTYSVLSPYSEYLQINSYTGVMTPLKEGLAKVKATLTVGNLTFNEFGWVYIASKLFLNNNSHYEYYVDIFGNSADPNQLVYRNNSTPNIAELTPTRSIGYDRKVNVSSSNDVFGADYNAIYLGDISNRVWENSGGSSWVTVESWPSEWMSHPTLLDSDEGWVSFKVKTYSDAISHYKALNSKTYIDEKDLYTETRCGNIVLKAADGSRMVITVIQSGRYGFYGELKDNIHNVVSANCLAPEYAWDSITWYGNSNEMFINSSLYPNSIIMPASGYACVASSAIQGMPANAIIGTMKSGFVAK